LFDIVSIGRALHWMDRERTKAIPDRLLKHGGAILICASTSDADGQNPWLETYESCRRRWAEPDMR
jgi:hypothetical protein